MQRPHPGRIQPYDTCVGLCQDGDNSHEGEPAHAPLRSQTALPTDAQGEVASYAVMRPDEGVIIEELNHLACIHGKDSMAPQRQGREECKGNWESSVVEIEAGTSAEEGDPATNRQLHVSLPKTEHFSPAQQETRAVTRSAATGQAVVAEGEELEEQHHDKRGTPCIVAKRTASFTSAQRHSTAGAGIHMVRHPMRKDVCQKSGFGAWRTGLSKEDGSTTYKIVSNPPLLCINNLN